MKKSLSCFVLFILGLSLCVLAGCTTLSVNVPSDTPAAAETVSPVQAAVSGYCYVVTRNDRKGVVDERGQVILPFEYSEANVLWQDETPVAIFAVPAVVKTGMQQPSYNGKLYGLDGKPLYEGDCSYAYTLSDDLILLSTMENKSGVISYGGEVIVPARYDNVMMCKDNIVAVSGDVYSDTDRAMEVDVYDKSGSLQRSGKLNFNYAYDDIIVITDDSGMKYGLVDIRFQEIVPPVWNELNIVCSGLCIVRSKDKYGVIDNNGNEIIPIKYSYIDYRGDWSDPKSIFFTAPADDGVYLFDYKGKQLFFTDKFTSVYIDNGVMIAQEESGLCHYINEDGEDIIPLAGSMYADTSGYIICNNALTSFCYTKEGEKLPFPESQHIGVISPDRFLFVAKGEWLYGICGADGSIIVPAQYSMLFPFFDNNGLAVFGASDKEKTRWGIISVDDGSILLDGFDMLESAGGGLFYAKKGPTSGLIDINGSWIWRTSDYETLMD